MGRSASRRDLAYELGRDRAVVAGAEQHPETAGPPYLDGTASQLPTSGDGDAAIAAEPGSITTSSRRPVGTGQPRR